MTLTFTVVACGANENGNGVMGGPKRPTSVERKPPSLGNARELRRCKRACKAGGTKLIRYCNKLPSPHLRAGCLGLLVAEQVACYNWCYWHFGGD